jgi:hypothetical protein
MSARARGEYRHVELWVEGCADVKDVERYSSAVMRTGLIWCDI